MTDVLPARLLIVDDVASNVELLVRLLEPMGHELLVASDGLAALALATRAKPDLILLDVMMPRMDGLTVCRRLKQTPRLAEIPVLFITALDEAVNLLAGFDAGGVDYVVKPFRNEEILARVGTHLALARARCDLLARTTELEILNARLIAERDARRRAVDERKAVTAQLSAYSSREAEHWGLAGFLGQSATMAKILADINKLHRNADVSVLISGESGTGKELVARAIHHASARAHAPFIPVNCAAIPSDLAESTLFGHVKGAFTGATSDRRGCFELAEGGTLFLDEIGDMPLDLQAKLLRVLEDGEVLQVGAACAKKTRVRIVAATNADLGQDVATGKFRLDLYYRLARFQLPLPPLRERSGDIVLLAQHFANLFASEMGGVMQSLTPEVVAALEAHPFPGNVRELKNLIERALILAGGETVGVEHLQFGTVPSSRALSTTPTASLSDIAALSFNLHELERLAVQRALGATQGNISRAASLLGVHRARIYRMMERYDADESR